MAEELISNRIAAAALTDTGMVRSMNQDKVFLSLEPVGLLPNLFIVADGMGGHKAGDLASQEAVRFFVSDVKEHSKNADSVLTLMKTALERTNRYIYYISQDSPDYQGMGTTFVVGTVIGYTLYCLNVGDSRMYRINRAGLRPVALRQITRDHSLVEMLRQQGVLTEQEAKNHPQKNLITRAIGIDETVEIDEFVEEVTDLTSLLMCSDGLTNMVSDTSLLAVMTDGTSPEERCRKLVLQANENGGRDNISVIVIDLRKENGENA